MGYFVQSCAAHAQDCSRSKPINRLHDPPYPMSAKIAVVVVSAGILKVRRVRRTLGLRTTHIWFVAPCYIRPTRKSAESVTYADDQYHGPGICTVI